ncbi:MAG: nucleoside triphosphate pyrophosphohydrolase [Candidatus Cloacimonetes bacterium]|nr:nucleoside triphosphate pyrophosphohydrolase [Candidatus Cloacimonadota bacterium]
MLLFDEFVNIVNKLRDPEKGCPWDIKQTSKSLIPNFIEEVYEAVEAIEESDDTLLLEELGDILLHVMLQAKIAEEKGVFTLDDVLKSINNKLIRRHPHVFADLEIETSDQAKLNWERIKLQEKKKERKSVLEGVPKNLPALIQAQRIQEKAASVGFDWDSIEPIFEKIKEEIDEVKAEIDPPLPHLAKRGNLEMEIGDLFFAVVNLSRKLKIDSESALRLSNEKFKTRFNKVEKLCEEKQLNMLEMDLKALDELWDIVKKD